MGNIRRMLRNMVLIVFVTGLVLTPGSTVQAEQTDLVGPPGSGQFGKLVAVLTNGNIVVTDPYYDAGSTVDVGAVYLYNGATGALISTLTGSTADDQVGSDGVEVLSNGNYVVGSTYWDNGGAVDAGAVTWCSSTGGCTGTISSANSLVGGASGDQVGSDGVVALSNGNYVVISSYWDNAGVGDTGAVTWGSGTMGVRGVISSTNSLVGSATNDRVGYVFGDGVGVVELSNGNYVVGSPGWNNAGVGDAGAATWGDGMTGISGVVSSANSLVGSIGDDRVGNYVVALSNGNYVVRSPEWGRGGAVTWGDGTTGISGVISSTNSLVGRNTASDVVGFYVVELSNGNYVVGSPYWNKAGAHTAGAVTWGDGTTGVTGTVSSANSLVGSTASDMVGSNGVVALSNGNYVVLSEWWNNGGTKDTGAATWGDGTTGVTGTISSANSLVGSTAGDNVGRAVTALSNGNYVVGSPGWSNGGMRYAGAVTWGSGVTGVSGVVSSANSLVGSRTGDQVGLSVTVLSNGNYVVGSPDWDNGWAVDAGAATRGSGTTGTRGLVSSINSLVGSTAGDQVGHAVVELSNGNYVVHSPYWDNGGALNAGAVTWGSGIIGVSGEAASVNSVFGIAASGGTLMVWAYDDTNDQLVVGRPADNIVTLFAISPPVYLYLPLVLRSY